ncbi:lipopolysaccharide biosynthesis protein [Intestinibacter sp.]
MRAESSLKNLIYAFGGQIIGLVISFVARIVFLRYLSEEYLGLNGLFTNILTMLSLVELGVGPAMTFSLYKPLAENDEVKIKSLMDLYRKMYVVIGVLILVIGVCLTPFLNVFIKDMPNIPNISLIYILFVLNSAVSYFYSYKRSLIISDQRRYIATIYRYACYAVLNLVQIICLIITKNYILFLVCQILFTWIENFLVSKKTEELYPYIKEKDIEPLDEETKTSIKKNIFAMVFHKLGAIIVNSTDNIILSKFVGIVSVGIYSNYTLIIQALITIIDQVFNSVVASIGNLGASEDKYKLKEVFNVTFLIGFWIFAFCSISILVVVNDFIYLWLRKESFVYEFAIVVVLVIKFYLTGMRKASLTFRDASGTYWQDRYKPLFESIINLLASIILVRKFGVIGIFIGTIISTLTTCFWIEPLVLYKCVLKEKVVDYYKRYIAYTAVGVVAGLVTLFLCNLIKTVSFIYLFVKVGICVVVVNLIFLVAFYKTKEFSYIKNTAIRLIKNR